MPDQPRRPDPEPLEVNEKRIVLVGLALWAVAFVVLAVFFHDDLRRHDATWWLWACLVGIALGLYALRFVSRRARGGAGPPHLALMTPRGHPQLEDSRAADQQDDDRAGNGGDEQRQRQRDV